MNQLGFAFDLNTSVQELTRPSGYKGLYAFHKYWGKKPFETVSFLVEQLSERDELVFDPFLGSGAIAREAFIRGRRVVGCDLNPAAIELASLIVAPPPFAETERYLKEIEFAVRTDIDRSYLLLDGAIATHYLWEKNQLRQVWKKGSKGTLRVELTPTEADMVLVDQFCSYTPRTLRPLRIFRNSRINSTAGMQWGDLFTGRALRNFELLREAILNIADERVRHALLLTLTASAGQMSKMVFAIEKRGKTSGSRNSSRVEVGSWVIGFWRPELHFEVNVWNCFENKVRAFLRGLQNATGNGHFPRLSARPLDAFRGDADVVLANVDALELLQVLPEGGVDLLVTDPPHGDRIPYLELSEIWNAILDKHPTFEREIVISDASERGHTPERYAHRMKQFFELVGRVLSDDGRVAIMFNSRSKAEWDDLVSATTAGGLVFVGCFPMSYSAGSVVQDNRPGALKHDYVLVFASSRNSRRVESLRTRLQTLPHWSEDMPNVGGL
jgi:hypothetical protein